MKIDSESRKGRLLCKIETDIDKHVLSNLCINTRVDTKTGITSVEDCLINRVALGLDVSTILKKPYPTTKEFKIHEDIYPLLKDYQIKDLKKIIKLRHSLDANPMGYGKTVEALTFAKSIRAKKVLIICPKSVRYQWADMCTKWIDKECIVEISPKKLDLKNVHYVITNYEQLINANILTFFKSVQWDLLILDEAHRIRNPKAKTTLAIKSLPASNKIALTGTPIVNRPDNLWSIGHFLNPSYLGSSYWGFVKRFCKIEDTFWGQKIVGLTEVTENQELLIKTLNLFIIRNPPGIVGVGSAEYDVNLEMYPKQLKLYKEVKTLAVEALQQQDISIVNGMSQLVRLQQITSNPGLYGIEHNSKFEWILDMLQDNEDLKIVVFSRFRQTVLALNAYLEDHKIKVATIHGEVSAIDRETNKKNFIEYKDIRVMSGTIGALGESVDGLHTVCNTVVFIDKMWNPEENNQAIGRVLRWGQQKFVNVYTLNCIKSVDEKVGKVNISKMSDIKKILGG